MIDDLDTILKELRACAVVEASLKRRSMRYQADLKDEVARDLGVSPESLDLPYEEWAAIRNTWLKARGRCN